MTTSPWLYQILHPWHWLTYGQNAAALQGVCALFGIIGLLLYVIDTRRMRRASELTLRASMSPVFTARDLVPYYANPGTLEGIYRIEMTVRNVGEGPAPVFFAWFQPVSAHFSITGAMVIPMPKTARLGEVSVRDLMKGETAHVEFDGYDPTRPPDGSICTFVQGSKWLFVMDSVDNAQGRHQLQMLMTIGVTQGQGELNMVHAIGDTFGEWVVMSVRRGVEILIGIKAEISKLFR